jgi:hypothetical protein
MRNQKQSSRRARWTVPLALSLFAYSACARAPMGTAHVTPVPAEPPASVAGLAAGTHIRYWESGNQRGDFRTDRVARASSDSLWLISGGVVPVARLARLEANLGPRLSGRRLAWSVAIGAAVGATLGALAPRDMTRNPPPLPRGEAAVLGGLIGFVAGTVTWVVVSPSERWTPVPLTDAERRMDR